METEVVYIPRDIIKDKVSLKHTPRIIILKGGTNQELAEALNIAVEHGYQIQGFAHVDGFTGGYRTILQRDD